jgi:hypothetical protein
MPYTPEYRALRSELIRRWSPWQKSTGPKTSAGKAVVAMNAWRGDPRGTISAARKLERLVSEDARLLALASQNNAEG